MRIPTLALSLCALAIASCGSAQSGDSAAKTAVPPFKIAQVGTETFNEGWAITLEPQLGRLFITEKAGTMKVLGCYAKKARGLMARYAIEGRVEKAEDVKAFDIDGYSFRPGLSTHADWVFARPQP